jgi:hypothetical protein
MASPSPPAANLLPLARVGNKRSGALARLTRTTLARKIVSRLGKGSRTLACQVPDITPITSSLPSRLLRKDALAELNPGRLFHTHACRPSLPSHTAALAG